LYLAKKLRVKKKVLILTDHENHSSENSLYALSRSMLTHPQTDSVAIATRVNEHNSDFFSCKSGAALYATSINEDFSYSDSAHPLAIDAKAIDTASYDLIWLRLPPPLTQDFLRFIGDVFEGQLVINNPQSIQETGSKEFLVNFSSVCPPMKICR